MVISRLKLLCLPDLLLCSQMFVTWIEIKKNLGLSRFVVGINNDFDSRDVQWLLLYKTITKFQASLLYNLPSFFVFVHIGFVAARNPKIESLFYMPVSSKIFKHVAPGVWYFQPRLFLKTLYFVFRNLLKLADFRLSFSSSGNKYIKARAVLPGKC